MFLLLWTRVEDSPKAAGRVTPGCLHRFNLLRGEDLRRGGVAYRF